MEPKRFDAIVVGAGPAGATAALYASRASLQTLMLEQGMPGGQIATSYEIDNYPGLPHISGAELGQRMADHAQASGAQHEYGMVSAVERLDDGRFRVTTDNAVYEAPVVIMATGAQPRTAGFAGETFYKGRGVSYCATCDAMFYRDKDVFVVGGGNSACEEALYLSRIAKSVTMLVRRDTFRAPKGMVDQLHATQNISVRFNTVIEAVDGDSLLGTISLRNTDTGNMETIDVTPGSIGVFVFVGNDPVVDVIKPLVELAPDGGVITDEHMATKTPGLFCAGDMRSKVLRQVVTAVSDGAIAATAAYEYLAKRDRHEG